MSRQIKIPDETYTRLKELAKSNYRTIGGQIDFLLNHQQEWESQPKDPLPQKSETAGLFQTPKS